MVVLGATIGHDEAVLRWIEGIRRPWLTDVMLVATFLGDGLIEVPFALIACWALWRLGRGACAKRYFFAGISGELLYVIAKASFQRDRPTIIPRMANAGWYSYPSGHAMMAPVLWGFGLLLLARSVTRPAARAVLLVLAAVIPPMIAVSRIYLGVHYPSDVVGALVLGNAWVLLWSEAGVLWPRKAVTSSLAATR